MQLKELEKYLHEYLRCAATADHCHNGLQVEGRPEIKKMVTATSFSLELVERAVEKKADAILVHHGIFGEGTFSLTGYRRERVKKLLAHDISLFGYHLVLDQHPEVGNNMVIAQKLQLTAMEPFDIGYIGSLPETLTAEEFKHYLKKQLSVEPKSFWGTRDVKRVGIVSGGAARWFNQVLPYAVEAYVTGEAVEWVPAVVQETGVNYVALGHYDSETFGVRALGEHLAQKFGLDVEFADLPCFL